MNEVTFWEIIESSFRCDNPEAQLQRYESRLEDLPRDDVVAFQRILVSVMVRAYHWDLIGAACFFGCGQSEDGCFLTLGQSGTIQGNLDVAHVVIDGVVVGDVRAAHRAELASAARIEGTLCYGTLEMAEGAKVNGKLLAIDGDQAPRLEYQITEQDKVANARPGEVAAPMKAGDGREPERAPPAGQGNT